MSTIATTEAAIMLCGMSDVTPFLWGFHGLGKSSVVKQLAARNQMGFIDFRCSQIEASDVRGLPDKVNGRTVYLPPVDMPVGDLTVEEVVMELVRPFQDSLPQELRARSPMEQHEALIALTATDVELQRQFANNLRMFQPRFQRGILFVDEINRAADDVQQAMFQLVLDREIGQYILPPGWFIVAAGNYNEGYQCSGFSDPAFLDRFCHLQFPRGESSLEEWVNYMSRVHGADSADVIEFATSNIDHLDGKPSGDLGFSITPSRRSWDAAVRVRKVARMMQSSPDTELLVLQGLVGSDLGTGFFRYSCPVKPRDLVKLGVAAKASDLAGLSRGQIQGLMWGLVATVRDRISEEPVGKVCVDFARWLANHQEDRDIAVAFCRALVSEGPADQNMKAKTAVVSNPRLARMIHDYAKKEGIGGPKGFLDRLCEDPDLQNLLSRVSWGSGGPED